MTMYHYLPDEFFILKCKDDDSLGLALVGGLPIVRDFEFSNRWKSIFLSWKNIPTKVSTSVYAIEMIIDYFTPFYAETWRRKKIMLDMYKPALITANRLRSGTFVI